MLRHRFLEVLDSIQVQVDRGGQDLLATWNLGLNPCISLDTVSQAPGTGPEVARMATLGIPFAPVLPWALRTDAWAESCCRTGITVFPGQNDPGYPDSRLP